MSKIAVVPQDHLFTVTVNRGDHSTFEELLAVLEDTGGGRPVDAASLQEMMSVQRFLRQFERAGWKVWKGNKAASQANPVVWNPKTFKADHMGTVALLPAATRHGIRNMAKQVNYVRGTHIESGEKAIVAAAHQIQTIGLDGRTEPAIKFMEGIDQFGRRRKVPVLVGADWNASVNPQRQSSDERRVLETLHSSWQWDHLKLGALPTRENRSIDAWALHNPSHTHGPRLVMVQHWTGAPTWDGKVKDHVPVYLDSRFA